MSKHKAKVKAWDEYFNYDPAGHLVWKRTAAIHPRAFNFLSARGKAGYADAQGYICIRIHGRPYRAHRIIWEMHNGPIEGAQEIDHINGDMADNRIENLRICDRQHNAANRGINARNTSGFPNVSYSRARQKWVVALRFRGQHYNVGAYDDLEDAKRASQEAGARIRGEFNRNLDNALHDSRNPNPVAAILPNRKAR